MTVDFEALDLVRGENKSRLHDSKVGELTRQNTELRQLVADAIKMIKEFEKDNYCAGSWSVYSDILEKRLDNI